MTARGTSGGFLVLMALIGLAAGLATWGLVDILPERIADDRQVLAVTAAAASFLVGLLATIGPLRLGAAVLASLIVALPATALFWAASFRFDDVAAYLRDGLSLLAFCLWVVLSLPFAIAAFRFDQDPTNYTALFENAWGIVTRVLAAAAFVALVWGAVLLSNVLLKLVGIAWIETLLDLAPAPFAISGLATGLALGVAHRMTGVIGPEVLIQLLRMLLPLVTVVTAVFLGALVLRGRGGLDRMFGDFSAGATIMAMGYGATLLIAAAVERGGLRAVQSGVMRVLTAGLALMLPSLGALSVMAVQARVAQYGWTPARLAAATAAALLCGYGATHLVAIVARREWMQRIRQGNVLMAVAVILAAALWLNPFIGPEEISARSLEARLTSQPDSVDDADLRLLAEAYGRAGRAVLDRVEATADTEMRQRIAAARQGRTPKPVPAGPEPDRAALMAQLSATMAVRPEGKPFPTTQLSGAGDALLVTLRDGCARPTPGGAAGCAALVADLLPDEPGDEAIILYLSAPGRLTAVARSADGQRSLRLRDIGGAPSTEPGLLDTFLAGDYRVVSPPIRALSLGRRQLLPLP